MSGTAEKRYHNRNRTMDIFIEGKLFTSCNNIIGTFFGDLAIQERGMKT